MASDATLTDQAQAHQLDSEGQQQDPEQQERPIGDGLPLDPVHQQLPTEDVETGLRMGHESLLTARISNNPNRARRLSLVNNVLGDHS